MQRFTVTDGRGGAFFWCPVLSAAESVARDFSQEGHTGLAAVYSGGRLLQMWSHGNQVSMPDQLTLDDIVAV